MPRQPNEKMIGLFVIIGLLTFASILAVFIRKNFFNGNDTILVMYFDESIKGLNVGSSVVFKGVEIGKVAKIDLIADPETLDFSIPIYARMNTSQEVNSFGYYDDKRALLNDLIEKGLRARLTTQSYLTGQLLIEFEMLPDTKIVLRDHHDSRSIMEIPTVLSPMGEISKGIQNIPIKQSVEEFNKFFSELNHRLPIILPQISQTFTNINKVVTDNSGTASDALDNFNRAASNVSQAAKSLRNLTDYLERHPEALLKGKGRY